MKYTIMLSPEAVQDLRSLKAGMRSTIREAIKTHLLQAPKKVSKSRIKRLRGMARPQYRLRVEDIRVFYDVSEATVEILAIIPKSDAASWLDRIGETE